MKMIAAVDENWAIGKDNELLAHIPEDMKFFRQTTAGHVVVMGRKTLESFPGKKPLKNRVNIVLTKNYNYQVEGAVVLHDTTELHEELKKYNDDEIFVIGGASIYKSMEPECDTALITKVHHAYEADAFFPDLDQNPEWSVAESSEVKVYEGLEYQFLTYRKRSGHHE